MAFADQRLRTSSGTSVGFNCPRSAASTANNSTTSSRVDCAPAPMATNAAVTASATSVCSSRANSSQSLPDFISSIRASRSRVIWRIAPRNLKVASFDRSVTRSPTSTLHLDPGPRRCSSFAIASAAVAAVAAARPGSLSTPNSVCSVVSNWSATAVASSVARWAASAFAGRRTRLPSSANNAGKPLRSFSSRSRRSIASNRSRDDSGRGCRGAPAARR